MPFRLPPESSADISARFAPILFHVLRHYAQLQGSARAAASCLSRCLSFVEGKCGSNRILLRSLWEKELTIREWGKHLYVSNSPVILDPCQSLPVCPGKLPAACSCIPESAGLSSGQAELLNSLKRRAVTMALPSFVSALLRHLCELLSSVSVFTYRPRPESTSRCAILQCCALDGSLHIEPMSSSAIKLLLQLPAAASSSPPPCLILPLLSLRARLGLTCFQGLEGWPRR